MTALVAPSGAAATGEGAPADFYDGLRSALAGPDPLDPVLVLLAGAGRASLPSFALSFREGRSEAGGEQLRLLVRGAASARLVTVGGERVQVDGGDQATWLERVVNDAAEVTLSAPGAEVTVLFGGAPPSPSCLVMPSAAEVTDSPEVTIPALDPPQAADQLPAGAGPVLEGLPGRAGAADADEDGFDFAHLLHEPGDREVEADVVRLDASMPDPGDPIPAPGAPDPTAEMHGPRPGDPELAGAPETGGQRVQAVACMSGHPNPPHGATCRECGGEIQDRRASVVVRPVLGWLHFDDGRVVPLDRPVLLGRQPVLRAPVAAPTATPVLVALPDPDKVLSRSHLEVRLDDWQVSVVDQDSRNGTTVELPGEPLTQLRPGEPCVIAEGTRVTLGALVSFRYGGRPLRTMTPATEASALR